MLTFYFPQFTPNKTREKRKKKYIPYKSLYMTCSRKLKLVETHKNICLGKTCQENSEEKRRKTGNQMSEWCSKKVNGGNEIKCKREIKRENWRIS